MAARILVTGASVAGTTTAWWLARYGRDVEVVERAPAFRDGGQNVDVRGTARDVLRRMGLEALLLERSTRERGTDWVTEDNHVVGRFEAAHSDTDGGPTAEMEIRRGDIARIIYEAAAAQGVRFRFGDSIEHIEQHDGGVQVTFAGGHQETYALVVIAEGVGSHTRELVFPAENRPRWMDLTIAYFSIPQIASDGAYARQYNTLGGRGAVVKPARDGKLGVYLGIQKRPGHENSWSVAQQRAFIRAQFSALGWEFPRILDAMTDVDDFYFDVLRQVHMDRWSNGRVVLTGDAAWCPTALSGIGTTLAIVGAYVLAGELARSDTPATAFAHYERITRPFVKQGQNIPKLVPRLLWPHTRFGLAVLRNAIRLASRPALRSFINNHFARDANAIALPSYE
jgi:2-polyprenyl-6-methoxyphenol hydroxylase-like FAD-dependent oxidoreductase